LLSPQLTAFAANSACSFSGSFATSSAERGQSVPSVTIPLTAAARFFASAIRLDSQAFDLPKRLTSSRGADP